MLLLEEREADLGSNLVGKLRGVLSEDAQVGLEVLLVSLELVDSLRGERAKD